MSTEFFNDQWRIPSNENQNKISNYSMEFDSVSSDYIDAGTGLGNSLGTYTGDASISIWFKADTTTSNEGLFSMTTFSGNAFGNLRINISNNVLYFVSSALVGWKTISFTDTTSWHHLVCIFKSGDITNSKIYLDGVDQVTTNVGTFPSSLSMTGKKTIIGAYYGTSNTFNGKIDQVTVFDYALSPIQVASLGLDGYAFNFIPNDYIDANTTVASNLDFSVSTWIKPSSYSMPILGTRGLAVAGDSNGITMNINSSGNLWARIFTETSNVFNLQTGGIMPLNAWSHVAMTYESSTKTLKTYLNGSAAGSMVGADPSVASTADLDIGRSSVGTVYNYFDGEISNTATFNTELTPTQVNTLYNNGKPGDISSLNPTGWWKLDDTATFNSGTSVWTIPDDSSNSNNGTSVGMNASSLVASDINGELIANPMSLSAKPIAYYQLGDQSVSTGANYLVPNNSLSDYVFNFQGNLFSGDYIDCGTGSRFNLSQTTISAWVKKTSSTVNYAVAAGIRNTNSGPVPYMINLSTAASNKIKFMISQSDGTNVLVASDAIIQDDIWYHVVGVADGSNVLIYVDGVLQTDQKTYNGTIISPNKNFNIGRQVEGGVYYWDGELSNISIFNTGLSSTDVQTLYNNGQPSDISSLNPLGWYKLNAADTFDGSDWTINDYGSGGNDGTSSGMDSSNLVVSDLQQTSGYSPYALDFDGTDDYLNTGNHSIFQITGAMTVSYWFNGQGGSGTVGGFGKLGGSNNRGFCLGLNNNNNITFYIAPTINSLVAATYSHTADNNWHHLLGVFTPSTSLELYFDGVLVATTSTSVSSQYNGSNNLQIGARGDGAGPFNGKMSNAAIWNTSLTSTEVTEIYNQGVPSNLNTFSGTAPISWWQLGSNSSYNSGLWTCLNEIGDKNFQSTGNMTNDDIVDGPGYSASGLGTSSIDIKGDAPYSTANGLSENMDVLDRTLDTPITNTHSIQLDGIDDYIDFGNVNIFERTDAFSGSCWVFNEGASVNQYIIAKRNASRKGYVLYFNSSGALVFIMGPGPGSNISQVVAAAPSTNTWNHLAFTYDGSSTRAGVKLYVNGALQSLNYYGQSTITGTIKDPNTPFQISGEAGSTDNVLKGKVDEVAMFNSELSAQQITSIYNNSTPGNILPLNPVSWHRFESLTTNGGVVTTADSSGNGLTGTVKNGAVLSTNVP